MTHKGWHVFKPQHNQNTGISIKQGNNKTNQTPLLLEMHMSKTSGRRFHSA